jgi:regulator of nucleoside diphosphate kinase
MSSKPIHITEFDLKRLRTLLFDAQSTDYRKSDDVEKLQMENNRAEVVSPKDVPSDVVTMNSTVCIEDLDTKEEEIYTLVFPENADLSQGKISILAPIGTCHVDQTFYSLPLPAMMPIVYRWLGNAQKICNFFGRFSFVQQT